MRTGALFSIYWKSLQTLGKEQAFPICQEGLIYQCPLNWRKRHNLSLQKINKETLPRLEVSLPHIVHVGVTSYCNLACPACPTGTKALGRPREHLSFDVFKRAVDGLRGSLLFMLFWDWGEPFMHPQLAEMIAYAKQSHIRTVVSTNGNAGNSATRIEKLVNSGIDCVIVCIDGATQQSYEAYRVGGRLDQALDTIRRLVAARRSLDSAYPAIEFRSLATRYSEPEMPDLLSLANSVEADIFSVKTLRPYDYRGHDVDNELVPLNPALARYAYEHRNLETGSNRILDEGALNCGKPVYAPTLNSDGTLAFCSYASYEEESFGNLHQERFSNIWKSKSARQKRWNFLRKQGTRSCETCYFRIKHKPTMLHTVQLRELPGDFFLENPETRETFLKMLRGNSP